MNEAGHLTRRLMLAAGLALGSVGSAAAQTGWPPANRLAFQVLREKRTIGSHTLVFRGGPDAFTVSINAEMIVKIGPLPVFRYSHQAVETWRDGRFTELQSQTISNGKRERVSARRSGDGLVIETLDGRRTVAPETLPLTHWNKDSLMQPLFNPQTGALVRKTVSRQGAQTVALADAHSISASCYTLSGDADIIDWYDNDGVWAALRGKVKDGSHIDYRRSS